MSKKIPKIKESRKFNIFTSIWIVPFIALVIAGWLAYQYFSQLGPEIRIVFAKNEGLQAGQSQIKYKDVPIGVINKIELQEDSDGVVVIARMDKSVKAYLHQKSKFWIVKPEVGISGVSGLDTLISGTYIDMYAPKKEKKSTDLKFQSKFIGLDYTYRNISGGEYFILNSLKGESSIKEGTPIYLKNIKVGQVEYVVLGLDDASIDVIIFIDKLYTSYINEDSNFWVRSTVDVSFENANLDISVAPFTDLIQGAIEFSTTGKNEKNRVPNGFIFELYKNKNTIVNKKIGKGGIDIKTFMFQTTEPIAKLKVNSLVTFEGFEVGKIKNIYLSYNNKKRKMMGQIILTVDTSAFKDINDVNHTGEENFYRAVEEGLRAKIMTSNPILGSLQVRLSFEKNFLDKKIIVKNGYALLPSVKDSSGSIMKSVSSILDKIKKLKIEKLIASLDNLVRKSVKPVKNLNLVLNELKIGIKNINHLTEKKSFRVLPDELNKTLKALTTTLYTTKNIIKGYKKSSLLTRQVSETLNIITETSKEMKVFLRMLNRKPNSMVFGDN